MTAAETKGHLAMLGANVMWGLMAPVSKLALAGTVITPLILTDMRIIGAALLFWTASLFARREPVCPRDLLQLFFASLLGIVFNQGSFIFGLSLTSPINASIITTSTPILTMIIAALYLREPVTGKKVLGILLGASGALLLILTRQTAAGHAGSIRGDLLCLTAQLSFSLYIVIYKGLITRYSPVTLMKWMFTYAAICIIPFSCIPLAAAAWSALAPDTLAEAAVVVFGGTFLSYLLIPVGQRALRPTVATMYNYMQPVVASIVAVSLALDTFGWWKLAAVGLIFSGVFLVSRSLSRAQMETRSK